MILKDKVAIVTGSSHGIGRAVALEFAKEGANPVVVGVTATEAANAVAQEIEAMGQEAVVVMTDVTDRQQVKNLVKVSLDRFGKIDILVNNAGFDLKTGPLSLFWEMTDEQWDKVMDVHVKGAYNCCQEVVGHMMERRTGKIINVTSPAALLGSGGLLTAAYATAMGGVVSFTRTLARMLASYRINVNAISPSAETRMFDEDKKDPKRWERICRLHPLGMPKPEDIAPVFAFLASEGANYITGQVLCADGGFVIAAS